MAVPDRSTRTAYVVAALALALLAAVLVGSGGATAARTEAPKAVPCQPGAVLARAAVATAADFPSTYTTSGVSKSFNCMSPADVVQAKRLGTGRYAIRFPGISNKGAGPLVGIVSGARVLEVAAPFEVPIRDIGTATLDSGGERVLLVDCETGGSYTDFCDFTVTLVSK